MQPSTRNWSTLTPKTVHVGRYNRAMTNPELNNNGIVRFVLAAVIALGAFIGGAWLSVTHQADESHANVEGLLWPDPPLVQPFHMLDHDGQPFTLERLSGRWTLLFFGFTHCPDVCPTSLQALADAYQQMKAAAPSGQAVQVVFVSVDPERDIPENLGPYVEYFSPEFIGVTSSSEEVSTFARSLGVLFMKVEQNDSYTMDHSTGIFYISPERNLVSVLTAPHNAVDIARRFEQVSAFIDKQT